MDGDSLVVKLLILVFFLLSPLTVLLHELGHAIPAIILTREKVAIFIGSYGDRNKSFRFDIGKLEVWIRYNPLSWRYGLCAPYAKEITINKNIFYTVTGPVTSFIVGGLLCYAAFTFEMHGALKMLVVIFMGSAIFDLILNLVPNAKPIVLDNGNIVYNDGYALLRLFYLKKFPKEVDVAIHLYNTEKYLKSGKLFEKFIAKNFADASFYKLAISSFLRAGKSRKADELCIEFIHKYEADADDFSFLALEYSTSKDYDKAMDLYDKSLELAPENIYSLYNKGFTLTVLEHYSKAIPLFDKLIEVDSSFSNAYSSRGLSKYKLGLEVEGLQDITHALQLEENDAYNLRSLGIYHLDKGNNQEAFKLFTKAKSIDPKTHMIDELLLASTHADMCFAIKD